MKKHADAFRSIGEVAKLIGVAPHVLRYWETQFTLLKPMKRPDGRRYYRPDDVRLVAGLCEILREEGLTIRGARKVLARDRGESVRARGSARLADLLGADLGEDMAEAASVAMPVPDPAEVPPATAGVPTIDPPHDSPSPPDLSAPDQPEADLPAPHAPQPAAVMNLAEATGDPEADAVGGHPPCAEGDLDPEALPEEDPSQMSDHSPRSRHRHRRRNGVSDGRLPLFPDLDSPAEGGEWLGRLAALATRLRDLPEGDRRAASARPGLAALRDAITTLY